MTEKSAKEPLGLLRSRRVSPVDLADESPARIGRFFPSIHAFMKHPGRWHGMKILIGVAMWATLTPTDLIAQGGPPINRPASINLPRQERDLLDFVVDEFITSIERTGDVRKVPKELMHPLFAKPPCEFLSTFILPEACVTVPDSQRATYGHSYINTQWIQFEHQASLNVPPWFRGSEAEGIQETESPFVPEAMELMNQLRLPARSASELERRVPMQLEYERRLQTHRGRHKHVDSPTYSKNFQLTDEAISQSRGRILPLDRFGVTRTKDGYAVVRAFFVVFVIKEQGRFQVAWLRPLN